jgi:hypothetical protein
MADATADQVGRYVLDGSDEDLRRLMSLSESFAEHAQRAFRAGLSRAYRDPPARRVWTSPRQTASSAPRTQK